MDVTYTAQCRYCYFDVLTSLLISAALILQHPGASQSECAHRCSLTNQRRSIKTIRNQTVMVVNCQQHRNTSQMVMINYKGLSCFIKKTISVYGTKCNYVNLLRENMIDI